MTCCHLWHLAPFGPRCKFIGMSLEQTAVSSLCVDGSGFSDRLDPAYLTFLEEKFLASQEEQALGGVPSKKPIDEVQRQRDTFQLEILTRLERAKCPLYLISKFSGEGMPPDSPCRASAVGACS